MTLVIRDESPTGHESVATVTAFRASSGGQAPAPMRPARWIRLCPTRQATA
ncbi:hypothetical protein [Azospirillum griseum]|uniref:hypothetical protein n=1 Tax=Azospirillum griseum TaxID=2496639 RepID=UPI001315A134|nr:hypothetical protein [Azospirillum griseum]